MKVTRFHSNNHIRLKLNKRKFSFSSNILVYGSLNKAEKTTFFKQNKVIESIFLLKNLKILGGFKLINKTDLLNKLTKGAYQPMFREKSRLSTYKSDQNFLKRIQEQRSQSVRLNNDVRLQLKSNTEVLR